MFQIKEFFLRLYAVIRGNRIHSEIDEEMRFHIEMRTKKNIEAGMTRDEAEKDALWRFGNVAHIKDRSWDIRGGGMIEILIKDLKFGLRMLLKTPGFTAVALITLALG